MGRGHDPGGTGYKFRLTKAMFLKGRVGEKGPVERGGLRFAVILRLDFCETGNFSFERNIA